MKFIRISLALGVLFTSTVTLAEAGQIKSATLTSNNSSVIIGNTEMAQSLKAAPGAIQESSIEQGRRVRFPSTGFRFFLDEAGLYGPAQKCAVAIHDTAHLVSIENCRFAQIANEMKNLLGSCPAKKVELIPTVIIPSEASDNDKITFLEKLNLTLDENCKASMDYYQYKKIAIINPLAKLGYFFDGGTQGYFDAQNESKTISLEEMKSLLDTDEQKAAAETAYKKYPENK